MNRLVVEGKDHVSIQEYLLLKECPWKHRKTIEAKIYFKAFPATKVGKHWWIDVAGANEWHKAHALKVAHKFAPQFTMLKDSQPKVLIKTVIEDLLAQYQTRVAARSISKATLDSVKRTYARIGEYWNFKEANQINREEWDRFQTWHELKWPGQDQGNHTKYMRVLRNYCLERGYMQNKPKIMDRNAKARRMARKKAKSQVFTDAEILRLEAGCSTKYELLALRLGYMMAFRISDVLKLTWDRIVFGEIPYIAFMGDENKAGFFGKCPVPDKVVEVLRDLEHTRSISKYVFYQVRNPNQHMIPQQMNFHAIRARGGVTWGTSHGLRHYRLTRDFKNPNFTTMQVCLIRRVSLQTANEHYCHVELEDLIQLRNAGEIVGSK